MRFVLIAAVAALLAGCATTTNDMEMVAARDAWKGTTYDDVVARWGVPARSTKLTDGRDAYTWVSETFASRPAFFPSIGIFGGGGVGVGTGVAIGGGAGGDIQRCERTLIFQNARVVEQTWTGPAEYCASFKK